MRLDFGGVVPGANAQRAVTVYLTASNTPFVMSPRMLSGME